MSQNLREPSCLKVSDLTLIWGKMCLASRTLTCASVICDLMSSLAICPTLPANSLFHEATPSSMLLSSRVVALLESSLESGFLWNLLKDSTCSFQAHSFSGVLIPRLHVRPQIREQKGSFIGCVDESGEQTGELRFLTETPIGCLSLFLQCPRLST